MPRLTAVLLTLVLAWTFASPALPVSAQTEGGSLSGSVTDPSGRPVAGATVTVVAAGDDTAAVATAGTDATGSWTIAGLPAGGYFVHVRPPSAALADAWWPSGPDPSAAVTVTPGVDTAGVDVALPGASRVAGTVVDRLDRPVEGAIVEVTRTFFLTVETTTATDGSFALDGLPADDHELAVTPPGDDLAPATVTVPVAEGETAEVRIVLEPTRITVDRIFGSTRVATAVAASERGFPDGAETVVVAASGAFPDALAAAPLAAKVGGPLLLVGPRVEDSVLVEVARLGATEVVIVGAVGAVSLLAETEFERAGFLVRRVAGDSRADTAALIAREVGAPGQEAIIASGSSFADALSVAPLAAAEGIPILLTATEQLSPDTAAALSELGVTRTIVVGGSGVVSDAVVAQLPSPTRVFGPERYATSVAIAELGLERSMRLDGVYVATGRDYPDALSAGPVAALTRGPLLLVDGDEPANAQVVYDFLSSQPDAVVELTAFGGTAAVSDAVLQRLATAIGAR